MVSRTTQCVQEGELDNGDIVLKADKRTANNKIRGMKLLTKEIRRKLPSMYSQEDKGGKAIVQVKFFTPDSGWTFYGVEFDGETDFSALWMVTAKNSATSAYQSLKVSTVPWACR